MTNLQEVPTEELLSFQDYPTVHITGNNSTIPITDPQITPSNLEGNFSQNSPYRQGAGDAPNLPDNPETNPGQAFWSLEYYQKFFDVDTKDVMERIIASITPKWDNSLKYHLRTKPDLYGPFWISVTLIFTIAICGNIANYLQQADSQYHWKYDFHLVSYAATMICLYVTLVPFLLWGLLKWSIKINDIEGLEDSTSPGILELICIYGYSLFIYIPVAILWTIKISILQWVLVSVAAFVSGSVLLLTLMPSLRLSRHRLLIIVGIICCHLLVSGFMVHFFRHIPPSSATLEHELEHEVHLPLKPALVANSTNNTTV